MSTEYKYAKYWLGYKLKQVLSLIGLSNIIEKLTKNYYRRKIIGNKASKERLQHYNNIWEYTTSTPHFSNIRPFVISEYLKNTIKLNDLVFKEIESFPFLDIQTVSRRNRLPVIKVIMYGDRILYTTIDVTTRNYEQSIIKVNLDTHKDIDTSYADINLPANDNNISLLAIDLTTQLYSYLYDDIYTNVKSYNCKKRHNESLAVYNKRLFNKIEELCFEIAEGIHGTKADTLIVPVNVINLIKKTYKDNFIATKGKPNLPICFYAGDIVNNSNETVLKVYANSVVKQDKILIGYSGDTSILSPIYFGAHLLVLPEKHTIDPITFEHLMTYLSSFACSKKDKWEEYFRVLNV